MAISGMEGMSTEQVHFELQQGAKIVRYYYCISVLIITFRRVSIQFVKNGESRIAKGLPYTLASLICGWWGIPWGPIWTIQALIVNFGGGKDLTQDFLNTIAPTTAAAFMPPPPTVPQ